MSIQMTRADGGGQTYINAYGDGGFRIGGARYEGSVLILEGQVIPWAVTRPEDIDMESLSAVVAAEAAVDLLIIGTGENLELAVSSRQALDAAGINADPMSTGAAARTYNVLLLEGRRVAAALIAVP